MSFAAVRISVPHERLDHTFHYIIPQRLEGFVCEGMRVYVPFGKGNRTIEGYVVGITDKTDYDISKLKEISDTAEEYSVVSEKKAELAKWMQQKYYCTLNACMMCIVPKFSNEKSFACISADFNVENRD
jgi:primosomal protein N' (replication factor Y)